MQPTRETFIAIRSKLFEIREEDGITVAKMHVEADDEIINKQVRQLQIEGIIGGIRRDNKLIKSDDWIVGQISIEIFFANLPGYFETWTDLIHRHPVDAPEDFYVYDTSKGDLRAYKAACSLMRLLKERSEVWDATQLRFFLVDKQAIEIPVIYSVESIAHIDTYLNDITKFLDLNHLEVDTRWNFFRKSAIKLIQDSQKNERLSVLFENVGNILERAKQDFSLYLDRYSFEEALKGFDEKRLKFIGDLSQVVTSVQTALLAVPVGFFLVAEKIKQSQGWTGQNIIIGSGGVIFCLLLLTLLKNQHRTLSELEIAVNEFGKEQLSKSTPKVIRIEAMVANAKAHATRIRLFLNVVTTLVSLFSVVIVVSVIWASTPALQKMAPFSPVEQSATPIPSKQEIRKNTESSTATNQTIVNPTPSPKASADHLKPPPSSDTQKMPPATVEQPR